MTRCVVSASALVLVSLMGCKSAPTQSADSLHTERPASEPAAEPSVGDAHVVVEEKESPDQDPDGHGDADALPAWAVTMPPEDQASEDLDGDGSLERVTLWCRTDDEDDGRDEVIIVVDDAREVLLPSLSEMIGCGMDVLGPAAGPKQLWVVAYEHDEVGPGTHYLFAYEEGRVRLLWKETAEVSTSDDGTWMTSESICWEDEGKETTYNTEYRFVAGVIESTNSEESTPVEPGDCETFDP